MVMSLGHIEDEVTREKETVINVLFVCVHVLLHI